MYQAVLIEKQPAYRIIPVHISKWGLFFDNRRLLAIISREKDDLTQSYHSQGLMIIINMHDNVRITCTPAGSAPAKPGYSCSITACTTGGGLRNHDKPFAFAGRACHTTDHPISPAICATFLWNPGYFHDHLVVPGTNLTFRTCW
mgnify:CR=1 FL=1